MKIYYKNMGSNKKDIYDFIKQQKQNNSAFKVIDVGGWAGNTLGINIDMMVDFNSERPQDFKFNISNIEEWEPLLKYIEKNGKFDYCVCTQTIEDISNPSLVLKMLPKIAHMGIISTPSITTELSYGHDDIAFQGFIHHRHIFDQKDNKIIIAPKLQFLLFLTPRINYNPFKEELVIEWEESIDFGILMNDYLGPTPSHVMKAYENFIKEAINNIENS